MKTNIQSVHFDADKKLIAHIEEKVGKLKKPFMKLLLVVMLF